jgi:hypothetical protein
MGRPLNHKFFGDLNYAAGGAMVGGEGIGSIVGVSGLTGMTANTSLSFTIDAAQITAPQIAGGTKPTLTFVANAATTGTVTIVTAGSGYTSAPTVSVWGNLSAGGSGVATPTVTLTSTRLNAIIPQVRISTTNRTSGNDIIAQKGSKRFNVQSQDGTGVCKLVTATPANPLEMAIVATDTQSNTYWVKKITKNKVALVRNSLVGATWDILDGDTAKWTITGSAVAPVSGGNPSASDGPSIVSIGTVVLNNA